MWICELFEISEERNMFRSTTCIWNLLALISLTMSADIVEEMANEVIEEAEPMFSTLDYVVLGLLGLGGVYYFFMKKKPEDTTPSFNYTIQPTQAPTSSTSSGPKGFMDKMKHLNRRMVVFYGSQTGTGEEFAGRLAKEGLKYGFRGVVADPEECEVEDLTELSSLENDLEGPVLAVFCVATYGEGDPTDNAQALYDWLQEGNGDVKGLRYAVFGLGNSTYEHFNAMGKVVDKKLSDMNGKRVHPLGLGDDDINIEDDFIQWKEGFWSSVCEEFGLEYLGDDFSMRQYEATELKEGEYNPERVFRGEVARLNSYKTQRPPFDMKNPYMAPVNVNRNLQSEDSDRYCMHIELGLGESRIRYEAGDHVAIYPTNDERLVNRIGELLNIDLDTVFTMKALEEDAIKKSPFPVPTTYRAALSHYVDITALPRTHVLKEIAAYTTDENEKEMLNLMTTNSDEGRNKYNEFISNACRHITHILEDLPSCKPAIDHLLELLPRLQPRFYSISSSGKVHKDSVHVTAVVIEYETPTGRTNNGVCTKWLQPMIPDENANEKTEKKPETEENVEGEAEDVAVDKKEENTTNAAKEAQFKVPIYVRRSQFRLPNRVQTPIIMVGPGTGVAPFRGFIQERALQKEQGKPVGQTHLYFGCRNKDKDFIYREELEKYVEDGVLTLHTAFSRDQPEKIYVTHRMRENFDQLWEMIGKKGGHVYICGDAKMMAKDVRNIIVEVVQKGGEMSPEEAEKYVKKMEQQKRYSADVWS